MQEWQEGAGRVVDDTTAKLKSSGENVLDKVRSSGDDLLENIHAKEHHLRDQMEDLAGNAADKLRDDDTRNNLLLGNCRCRDSRRPWHCLPEKNCRDWVGIDYPPRPELCSAPR